MSLEFIARFGGLAVNRQDTEVFRMIAAQYQALKELYIAFQAEQERIREDRKLTIAGKQDASEKAAKKLLDELPKRDIVVRKAEVRLEALNFELSPSLSDIHPALLVEIRSALRELDPADRLSLWMNPPDEATFAAFLTAPAVLNLLPPESRSAGIRAHASRRKPELAKEREDLELAFKQFRSLLDGMRSELADTVKEVAA